MIKIGKLKEVFTLISDVYKIVSPFGRRRIVKLAIINFLSAFVQFINMGAIFGFVSIVGRISQGDEISTISFSFGEFVLPQIVQQYPIEIFGVGTILTVVLVALSTVYMNYFQANFSAYTNYYLTTAILRTFANKPYSFHLQYNSAILIKKAVGDVGIFDRNVFLPLIDLSGRIPLTLSVVLAMFVADPVSSIALGGIFTVYYFLAFLGIRRFWSRLGTRMNALNRVKSKLIYQFFSGIKTVLIQNRKNYFLKAYEDASVEQRHLKALNGIFGNLPRILVEILVFGGGIAFVIIAIRNGADLLELAPIASVFAFGAYRMLPNFQFIFGAIGSIQTSRYSIGEILEEMGPVDFQRIYETLGLGKKTELEFNNWIGVNNVHFAYAGADECLFRELNLTIAKGEKVAFIGKTGSGKSTLVDLLLGLHLPEKGSVEVDGKALDSKSIENWRATVGYVPQDIFLLDDTIRRNVAFGVRDEDIDDEAVIHAIKVAQADEFIFSTMPEGLDSVVGERGVRLSGGQRQRIGLARAFYRKPQVLIFDEATSALDNATEAKFMDVVASLDSDLTIISIAHRLTTVKDSDCIYILDRGQIVDKGSYEELEKRSDLFN